MLFQMDNVTEFPKRDLVAEMTGPENGGCSVIIDGRLMPHVAMYDRGDTVEFVIDHRLGFPFPREIAYQAASFAFSAMAVAAGFRHQSGLHHTQHPYAGECVKMNSQVSDGRPSAGGMQTSATEGAITRSPAHPMATIAGGPIGPSDPVPLYSGRSVPCANCPSPNSCQVQGECEVEAALFGGPVSSQEST